MGYYCLSYLKKTISLVFDVLMRLFVSHHETIDSSSEFIWDGSSCASFSKMMVSSAYLINCMFGDVVTISSTWIENNSGLNTQPCRLPIDDVIRADIPHFDITIWVLSDRKL